MVLSNVVPDQTITNSTGWNSLLTGEYHIGYAALGLTGLGFAIVLGIASGAALVCIGLLVLALGVAILVDTWSNGYFH